MYIPWLTRSTVSALPNGSSRFPSASAERLMCPRTFLFCCVFARDYEIRARHIEVASEALELLRTYIHTLVKPFSVRGVFPR